MKVQFKNITNTDYSLDIRMTVRDDSKFMLKHRKTRQRE